MRGPDRLLALAAQAASGSQRAEFGQVVGHHEQFGECLMRIVGGRRGQHHFTVGRQFDVPRFATAVGERDAAHFTVVLSGYQHVHRGGQVQIVTNELGMILTEYHLVTERIAAQRLSACGPDPAVFGIAQEDEGAVVVPADVLAPARDREVAPAAVAGTCCGEHHGVAAVAEQMGNRRAARG